jgi:hypothetical protein
VFATRPGANGVAPAPPLEAYAAAADQLPRMFDVSPGNLERASEAVGAVAGTPEAPAPVFCARS